MIFRKRRKPKTKEMAKAGGHPLLRILTTDLALRAGSYALRRAVDQGMVRGKAAAAVPDHKPSVGTRVLTAAASTIATRSVPGALLVGSGILVHTLYQRGKARRAEKLLNATGVGGTLPPT
ncbi:hypothetical protein [Alteraurantiacibacter buctensis]|uniref:Uncharacterized protein n=1 Tax=Alteraurantiacibacter buctensis TaxID=1503981 RepID=A0A844Z0Q2_9SPHN|nr:hypothetical protein [Alteraurantiacibacter buctensis]MXO73092.1 hypothetical protein [Alteraurantiacibacter buctensis]